MSSSRDLYRFPQGDTSHKLAVGAPRALVKHFDQLDKSTLKSTPTRKSFLQPREVYICEPFVNTLSHLLTLTALLPTLLKFKYLLHFCLH
jgi:hypothetical protein